MKKDFLWGNSVSSMQTEGGWNEGGKGLSVYDQIKETETTSDWKVGIDAYHRYQEDFQLMKEQGYNCYRFQISWSRVCPDGDGEFNSEGLKFYHQFIDDLIAEGIQPYICLYHFDMPLNLYENHEGFLSKYTMTAFVRYAKRMVDEYGDKVKLWMTFNEQNFSFLDYEHSFGFAGVKNKIGEPRKLFQIGHNVLVAHCQVANYIHEKKAGKIGVMIAYEEYYPANSKPENILLCEEMDQLHNHLLLHATTYGAYPNFFKKYLEKQNVNLDISDEEISHIKKVKNDFIAFSYYQTMTLDILILEKNKRECIKNSYATKARVRNPFLQETEWQWEIDPIGFRTVLEKISFRYNVPVFPVENGIGVREMQPQNGEIINDDYRIDYHQSHLFALKQSIEKMGIEVMGYLGWGLIDIPSSSGDMEKRYGTVFVNRTNHNLKDLKRTPKKSFYWFQKMIETNGAILKGVNNYD